MTVHSGRTAITDVASVCVIGATITVTKSVLVPLCFAMLLAAVLWPPVRALKKRRVPLWLALTLVSTGALLILLMAANLLVQAADGFLSSLPEYARQLDNSWAAAVRWLGEQGVDVSQVIQTSVPGPGAVLSSLGGVLSGVAAAASSVLMVVLVSLFLLVEAGGLADKARRAFGDTETTAQLVGAGESLQQYLMLKTLISLITGLIIAGLLASLGREHAILWGFTAFLLNYIPNVGSIVAALPAVALAFITDGPIAAGLVSSVFLAVNMLVGNWMEPRLMGESLGLSPLVVLLALVLWGWMWGPAGMLLSVPLTVLLKELLAVNPSTRWIAELLGPNHNDTPSTLPSRRPVTEGG